MKRIWKIALVMAIGVSGGVSAEKLIVVDLTQQKAFAYKDGREVMSGWVSTGKPGKRTPTGKFRILEKDIDHVSSKYPRPNGGARMNYMMRLTNSGVAMHLGYVPNYPASHGCIRLENGFAQKMYAWAPVGTKVIVKGTPPIRVDRSSGGFHHYASSATSDSDPLDFFMTVPGKKRQSTSVNSHKKERRRVTAQVSRNRDPLSELSLDRRVERVETRAHSVKPRHIHRADPLEELAVDNHSSRRHTSNTREKYSHSRSDRYYHKSVDPLSMLSGKHISDNDDRYERRMSDMDYENFTHRTEPLAMLKG